VIWALDFFSHMKIKFWQRRNFSFLVGVLTYPCFEAISDYIKTSSIDFFLFWFSIALWLIYFIPNYFSNILEVTDKFIIIKNGVFQRAINIEIDRIKSIELVTINHEVLLISIKLRNGDEIPWYTKNRTQEMYNNLMDYCNLK